MHRPRGVHPFAAGAGHRHQRVWDIDQSLIATEAIREPMEQRAETLWIVEGFRQQPEAVNRSPSLMVSEGGRVTSASLARTVTSVSGTMSGAG
jgi:hypothetical protein